MLKVNNVVAIPVSLGIDFFRYWFDVLHPFHGLSKGQVLVIATFVKYRYELSKSITDPKVLDEVLMSREVKNKIRDECGISKGQFQVICSQLRKKGLILGERLNPKFIPKLDLDSKDFKLLILFKFEDSIKEGVEGSQ